MLNCLKQVLAEPPAWISDLLERVGIGSLGELQERLSTGLLMRGSQYLASQALDIGQNTFEFIVNLFVMLYLLFFLLRDGDLLAARIRPRAAAAGRAAKPAAAQVHRGDPRDRQGQHADRAAAGRARRIDLLRCSASTARCCGRVVMAFLSLLPAVGAGLVWVPVALYCWLTGAIWQGVVLIAFGALVIGMVDNVLRPVLVGKDTRMPDYVVLISTLGGLQVFGLNGFVHRPGDRSDVHRDLGHLFDRAAGAGDPQQIAVAPQAAVAPPQSAETAPQRTEA